ncbi:hypothetical protein [Paraburkholderia terricola]|uniref:hypothetical protein n=1 Tax=Paraburkholderia terricola TaxID=169427 RepID=UPI003ECDC63A
MSTPGSNSVDRVKAEAEAEDVVAAAKACGVVVTINLESDAPLAMGNYRMVVDARPARYASLDAVEFPEPQPTDQISRWLFDAVKTNLDQLHALYLEFGCQPGDTVVDWLRARLAAQQPID